VLAEHATRLEEIQREVSYPGSQRRCGLVIESDSFDIGYTLTAPSDHFSEV